MDPKAKTADKATAKKLLEDAVKINPFYLSAVINLSKIHIEESKFDMALLL